MSDLYKFITPDTESEAMPLWEAEKRAEAYADELGVRYHSTRGTRTKHGITTTLLIVYQFDKLDGMEPEFIAKVVHIHDSMPPKEKPKTRSGGTFPTK